MAFQEHEGGVFGFVLKLVFTFANFDKNEGNEKRRGICREQFDSLLSLILPFN